MDTNTCGCGPHEGESMLCFFVFLVETKGSPAARLFQRRVFLKYNLLPMARIEHVFKTRPSASVGPKK